MTAPAILIGTNLDALTTVTTPFDDLGFVVGVATDGAGVWVAVGQQNIDVYPQVPGIARSTDNGATWTLQTSTMPAGYYYGVTYGAGLFCAIADSSSSPLGFYIETSPDGITWTAQVPFTDSSFLSVPKQVSFANSKFIISVVDAGQSIRQTLVTSPDGAAWTINPAISGSEDYEVCGGGAWAGDRYLAASNNQLALILASSTDASTWITQTEITGFYNVYGTWVAGVAGNYRAAYRHALASSTDGTTWTFSAPAQFGATNITFLNYINSAFMAGGEAAAALLTSATGASWTAHTLPVATPSPKSAAFDGTHWVIGGQPDLSLIPPAVPGTQACGVE